MVMSTTNAQTPAAKPCAEPQIYEDSGACREPRLYVELSPSASALSQESSGTKDDSCPVPWSP